MKTRNTLALALTLMFLGATTGCERAYVLKTPLETDEIVSKDDVAFVDGTVAGHVKKLITQNSQRVAELAVTGGSAAKGKMRTGVVRVREGKRVSLRTDEVDVQAPPLANGALIPLMAKPNWEIRKLTWGLMLAGLLVGLVIVLVVLQLFRRLARGWMLLLTLVLSGGIAWVALPWATGAVAKVYGLLPATTATTDTEAVQKSGGAQALSRLVQNPPDPQAVAYAAVFVAAFIILSVALRASLNRLENRTCS